MATYVIGDIHGCYRTLRALLGKLPLDSRKDRLWLTGDLVNRGPASAKVLRWARKTSSKMGDRFQTVLGNHDLHLIAVADGVSPLRRKDNLADILEHPDRDELIGWLRQQPFLYRRGRYTLVHAGLHPRWSPLKAEARAAALERAFASKKRRRALLQRNLPRKLVSELKDERKTMDYLTRVRACFRDHSMSPYAGRPRRMPPRCAPWYRLHRRCPDCTIVFGHWAALGLLVQKRYIALDTGCAWGNRLTAIRLKDRKVFSVSCRER